MSLKRRMGVHWAWSGRGGVGADKSQRLKDSSSSPLPLPISLPLSFSHFISLISGWRCLSHGPWAGQGGELALNLLIIDYCFVRSQFAAQLLLLLLFVACLLLQIENANCSSDLPARSRCGRSCSRSQHQNQWRLLMFGDAWGRKQIFINF